MSTPEVALLSKERIQAAVAVLKQGGLVAFPTETVYGLGANAEDESALDRLYTVKGRPKGHPVIVHLASLNQLVDWAEDIPQSAWQLAHAFWPGPLTLILKRSPRVPNAVTGGQDTVGVRVPAHPVAIQLLQAFGGGIAAPSANRFGRLSPTRAAHVQADLGNDVDMILEGGDCLVGVESTIVAFGDGVPVILRPGMITAEQIEAVLKQSATDGASAQEVAGDWAQQSLSMETGPAAEQTVIRAPGTLASHYAPRTLLRLVSSHQLAELKQSEQQLKGRLGILARQEKPVELTADAEPVWICLENKPDVVARELYARLRDLDALGLDEIWVEDVPEEGAWTAVADRLKRAAHQG